MDKIDKILRNEGLQYTTIDYQGEKCYLINSLKLYLYIREDKNSEVFREFRAIVPTGNYFIWYTKAQVENLKKIRALKNKKVKKELSKYQDGKRVVNNYATKMRENPTEAEDSSECMGNSTLRPPATAASGILLLPCGCMLWLHHILPWLYTDLST